MICKFDQCTLLKCLAPSVPIEQLTVLYNHWFTYIKRGRFDLFNNFIPKLPMLFEPKYINIYTKY